MFCVSLCVCEAVLVLKERRTLASTNAQVLFHFFSFAQRETHLAACTRSSDLKGSYVKLNHKLHRLQWWVCFPETSCGKRLLQQQHRVRWEGGVLGSNQAAFTTAAPVTLTRWGGLKEITESAKLVLIILKFSLFFLTYENRGSCAHDDGLRKWHKMFLSLHNGFNNYFVFWINTVTSLSTHNMLYSQSSMIKKITV